MILAISAKNREKINTNLIGRVPTSTGVGGEKQSQSENKEFTILL